MSCFVAAHGLSLPTQRLWLGLADVIEMIAVRVQAEPSARSRRHGNGSQGARVNVSAQVPESTVWIDPSNLLAVRNRPVYGGQ